MASYELRIKESAAKELEAIGHKRDRSRIVERIRLLADDPRPRGCEKLSGSNRYRVRQGNHRILYSVDDEASVVTVVKIGHRRDVYRGAPDDRFTAGRHHADSGHARPEP